MPFTLDKIVPWGRSMGEYVEMFSLSEDDLDLRILGCSDGPAGFNAEMTALGHSVVSVDPLYRFSGEDIRLRIDKTYPAVMQQLCDNRNDYVWTSISSPEALGELRLRSMERFLADFPDGKASGRYLAGELPDLPFESGTFDLALCSHLLFFVFATPVDGVPPPGDPGAAQGCQTGPYFPAVNTRRGPVASS